MATPIQENSFRDNGILWGLIHAYGDNNE